MNTASGLVKNISTVTIAETSVDLVIDSLRSAMNPARTTSEHLSLLDIGRETDVVRATQELFSNILAQRLAALIRQHNTMIPINKLPTEILAHIISLSIHSRPWSISTLHGLASVCSRWWRIIITTPSLWATARLFEKPELALKLSKEFPLTVHVQDMHHSEELERFIAITGPHAHRWQSVFVEARFTDHLLHYLAFPLPQLEELRLEYTTPMWKLGMPLTLGAAPKLRHLHLCGIAVDWEVILDLPLETLSLSHIVSHGPSMRQLYHILASSPHLTHLILCDLRDPIDVGSFQAELLSLERLCKVEIRDIGQHTLAGLAEVLQAESLSSLNIAQAESLFSLNLAALISPSPNTSHLQNLLRPSSKGGLLPSVMRNQALDSVYVKTSAWGFRLSDKRIFTNKSGACLDLEIQGMAGTVPLLVLGAPDRGYDVDLDVTECGLSGEELCRVLGIVDPLVLRVGSGNIHSVMEALSRVPASEQERLCPRLRDLHLVTSRFDSNGAVTTLQARNGPEETEALTGRSKLLVYDAGERLFNPKTRSFKPRALPSKGTPSQQNVEEA